MAHSYTFASSNVLENIAFKITMLHDYHNSSLFTRTRVVIGYNPLY